jgi:hypothetical protein
MHTRTPRTFSHSLPPSRATTIGSHLAALGFFAGLLLHPAGLAQAQVQGGGEGGGGPDREAIATEMERAFRGLEATRKEIPRETFDPSSVVEKIGKSPEKLFEWVRDQTSWVPYRGLLRGDRGVLMDRRGNSLDRAMLLRTLILAAGHQARLARATLGEGAAAGLLAKVRPAPAESPPQIASPASPEVRERIERSAREARLDEAALLENYRKTVLGMERTVEDLVGRTAEEAPRLAALVGRQAADPAAGARAEEISAIRDHFWVQAKAGDSWIDLDPLLPDATPGQAAAPAAETLEPRSLDDLPEGLLHTLKIRLVVEYRKAGRIEESVALEQKLLPARQTGEAIVLRIVPADWPASLSPTGGKASMAAWKKAVLEQHEWIPILKVGSQTLRKLSFTDDGRLIDTTAPGYSTAGIQKGLQAGSQGAGKGVGGALSTGRIGQAGSARKAGPADGAVFTAAWIDYEVSSGGGVVRKFRREVFDLVGPAARAAGKTGPASISEEERLRRGLSLLEDVEILPLAGQPSPEYVADLRVANLLQNREAFLEIVRKGVEGGYPAMAERMKRVIPFHGSLHDLAIARRLRGQKGAGVYLDHLNILTHRSRAGLGANGDILYCRGFDIVSNGVAVRAGQADPFLARLEQGVLDTCAEALLAARCGKVKNTAELFAGAGISWRAIRSRDDPGWKDIPLPLDVRARIESDLAAGKVAVVPEKPSPGSPAGWWRIDPATGETLGIGEDGAGQSETEASMVVAMIATAEISTGLCLIAASSDKDGAAPKDYVACIGTGVIGGLGLFAVGPAGVAAGCMAMAGDVLACLLAGLMQNKNIPG